MALKGYELSNGLKGLGIKELGVKGVGINKWC